MSDDRVWYIHKNGLREGPLTLAEMLSRKAEGSLRPDTQVWRKGLEGWVRASSVEELRGPSTTQAGGHLPVEEHDYEKSLMLELNRSALAVDDRTTAIDRSVLRRAHGEAREAARTERKTGGAAPAGLRSSATGSARHGLGWAGLFVVLPALSFAGVAVGLRLGVVEPEWFGPQVTPHLEKLFSSVPELPGVSPQEQRRLRRAARSRKRDRVELAWVFAPSPQKPGRRILYLASNLPDGTVLRVGLQGPTELTFPLTIRGGLARSRELETAKGGAIPSGRYLAFAVESAWEEQSDSARAFLEALPPEAARAAGRLPAGVGTDHRFVWAQELTISDDR